jgi:hypothetical protein
MKNQTVQEFLQRLEQYKNPTPNSVIIHPGWTYCFIELNKDFMEQLKNELRTKLMMAEHGIDELDAITKFAIMVLEDSY